MTEPTETTTSAASLASSELSRRRFLTGTTVAAGLTAFAVACGKDKKSSGSGAGQTAASTTPTTAANANNDLDVAAAAAGLEKLAVDTYTAAGTLATQGKLGAVVPAAVVEFVTTAAKQHQEHLDAWNKVLTGAGKQAVNSPNAQLKPTVDAAAGKLTDVPGAATLALRLENYASQTYLSVIPTLKSADAVKLASQILVVDQQHQAILRYVLGLYPVGSGVVKDTSDFAPAEPKPELLTA